MGLWSQLFGHPGVTVDHTFTGRAASADPFRIPIVVAARQLVADTVSSFTLQSWRGAALTEPQAPICARPNPLEPAGDTFERIVNQMTRHGTAALRVMAYTSDTADRRPLAIEVIDWPRINFQLDSTGAHITNITVDRRDVPLASIILIPFILDDGSPIGVSPLVLIQEALENINAAYLFAATYYGAGAVPPYALITPTRLTAGKAQQLLDSWQTARESSRPAVLSGNLTLETFSPQSAADALVLDAINYLDATVARVMQVPSSILNAETIGGSLSYSTTRDEFRRWLAVGLNTGYLHRIEAAFTEMLPRGITARFDTSSLTRLDETERNASVRANLAAEIIDIPEARRALGLPESRLANDRPRPINA